MTKRFCILRSEKFTELVAHPACLVYVPLPNYLIFSAWKETEFKWFRTNEDKKKLIAALQMDIDKLKTNRNQIEQVCVLKNDILVFVSLFIAFLRCCYFDM